MLGDRGGSIVVLAGPGNNGGDAFVAGAPAAGSVLRRGRRVSRRPARACRRTRPRRIARSSMPAEPRFAEFPARWRGSLIVDGLFGIGLARPLDAQYASQVEWANASGTPILALDIPSGIDADTGIARGPVIRAAATATFIALKPGLLTGDGLDLLRHRFGAFARSRRRSDGSADGPSARLGGARRGAVRPCSRGRRAT